MSPLGLDSKGKTVPKFDPFYALAKVLFKHSDGRIDNYMTLKRSNPDKSAGVSFSA